MANIGKVTVNTPKRTIIVSQDFKAKPNVSLSEINGVDITSTPPENLYALVYNSSTGLFEPGPAAATQAPVEIKGGSF